MKIADFEQKDYKVFDLFRNHWAAVAAGTSAKFNACTMWTRPGKTGSTVTVYLYPSRYTRELLTESDTFTVNFFPDQYKKALGILGSSSGRDGDKIKKAGLTPVSAGKGVAFEEASLTFVCKKLYQHPMTKADLAPEICDYYESDPGSYPALASGEWEPHWVFVGEITEVIGK